ncbi:hypothetical protein KP003_06820 [Geomonas nitrogeniifigens]|uniref:Restriction endonuclease type IV Mrr domain-containing protein n=1 Tax=Geomonas diazotrophica TaxID=2843197 RepID=A0ABX8JU56_9BACT|nr:restriction endonuclease [Geomonas nitrogeniifigens]QWV98955.1 hypothetical protein KP005_06660 [Geomonas nitrogeniifigens]QXE88104.1 hypothetical protein KP003_06820 [Geomonas nitrogeniifigens]
MKKFSPNAILALKEALTHIYWKKQDLRSFVYHTVENKVFISTIDWDNNKKAESAGILVDRMVDRPDLYENDLLKLFDVTMHFDDFGHLKQWDDADTKIKKAKEAVEALRKHASGYFQLKEEKEKIEARRNVFSNMQKEKESFSNKISVLKDDFMRLVMEQNAQKRGFAFEKFLNSLFMLFDLEPKESFRITGEQIDGAFTFDGNDFLLEAKWQEKPIDLGELYKFGGKIEGKFKLTLGLAVSINGFTADYNESKSSTMKTMLLMDGADLMAVLENRIDLKDMLFRKRRHASDTGDIFFKFRDM